MLFAGKKRAYIMDPLKCRWDQMSETFFKIYEILLGATMFFVAPCLLLLRMCDVQLPYAHIIGCGTLLYFFFTCIYIAVGFTLELKAKLGEFTLWSLKDKLKYLFAQWALFLCIFALPGVPIICILSKLFKP